MHSAANGIVRTSAQDGSIIWSQSADSRERDYAAAEARLLARFDLPVRSIDLTLDRPRIRARALEMGEGAPVLMLHGGGGFAALWAPLMTELRGVRLIAVDRPGCGMSEGFDYRGVDLKEHAVDFVESVMDSLGLDRVAIVANSMGATWSLWFAAEHPERVASLALLGSPALILGTSAPLPMRLVATRGLGHLMVAAEPPGPKQARRTFTRMGHGPSLGRIPAELFDAFEAAERLTTYPSYWSLLRSILRVRGLRPGIGLSEADLARVSQPVQLTWGSRDPFAGAAVARRAAAVIPHAQLDVIDAGHLPWVDDAEHCGVRVRAFLGAGD